MHQTRFSGAGSAQFGSAQQSPADPGTQRRIQREGRRHRARHRLEAWVVKSVLAALRAVGPVHASNLAGAIFRGLGPLLPVSRIADTNLRLALPEYGPAQRRRIIRGAWDNLGRNFGELPHIAHLQPTPSGPGWDIIGAETLQAQAAQGGPALFVSGHIGNWEMLPPIVAHFGIAFASVYRPANNPLVDELMAGIRQQALAASGPSIPMFGKGAHGARRTLRHLSQGGYLGLLVDQKMNDGLAVEFFGRPAMTASAPAALALRLGCPVIPGHIERLGPARLRLVCDPPLPLPNTGQRERDIAALTQTINDRMEAWIRERPESWLWMHRRWPKPLYRNIA
jgi:KDO2-lipid IV(A) lauroyltransferase